LKSQAPNYGKPLGGASEYWVHEKPMESDSNHPLWTLKLVCHPAPLPLRGLSEARESRGQRGAGGEDTLVLHGMGLGP